MANELIAEANEYFTKAGFSGKGLPLVANAASDFAALKSAQAVKAERERVIAELNEQIDALPKTSQPHQYSAGWKGACEHMVQKLEAKNGDK